MIGKKYNLRHIKKDWKKFKSNNKSITLNILYVPYDKKKIRPPYIF